MEIPNSFYCPISKQVMTDPVITPLGISYERSSIEEWLTHIVLVPFQILN